MTPNKNLTTQHYDLLTTIADDGSIKLQQMDYCGECATIHLHPDQLRALSEEFSPSRTQTSTTPADVVLRRFKLVVDTFKDAIYDEHTHDEIWERAACAEVLYARLAAADDMAEAFIADCEIAVCHDKASDCHEMSRPVTKCHDKSESIIVTNGKRGRPATGQALTDAERQAKRRAKTGTETQP